MTFLKKFISIWNEVKRFPGFMGKKNQVDQLNDPTAFPWFLNFCKNFSADYRKRKNNRWDYLTSIHDYIGLVNSTTPNEKDRADKRIYLIDKYNERLLIESNDKYNPWVIDDRDDKRVILYRKKYLEFEKQLSHTIETEIAKKRSSNTLSEKGIQLESNRLSQLAKLELLKVYKEENIAFVVSLTKEDSYWLATREKFAELITLQVNEASIQHEIRQIKKQQEKIIKELHDYFAKEKESVKFYPINSVWEKINEFITKNKLIQFFSLFWYGVNNHANLLSWISFLFIFFSLSLSSYPIIFLILGISLVGYLGWNFFYLVKKKSIIFPGMTIDQAEHILESVKISVFNEEKTKKEFELIHEMIYELSRNKIILDKFFNSISIVQKNFDHMDSLSYIQQSELYQHLIEVFPVTQYIASMTINLSSVVFYIYLLTWAMHSIFAVLGAVSVASFMACPLVVGILILITATFFLLRHLCEFLARDDFYQKFILNKLNEKCEYSFKDENGNLQIIQIEKWKKFEYLQKENYFLESKFKEFFQENNLEDLNKKFSSLFNNNVFEKNLYISYEQDRVLGVSGIFFTRLKKILNRFFAFSGGGFYGYNLTQQIVWKSKLGLHILVRTLTLPILLIFIPFIMINGIANFIAYHFHSRQRNRCEMAENLDNKLEVLEQTNKKLLYLAALSNPEINPSADFDVNQNVNPNLKVHASLSLPIENTENNCFTISQAASFFNSNPRKNSLCSLKHYDVKESNKCSKS